MIETDEFKHEKDSFICFRLLNSEIGNDLQVIYQHMNNIASFRLLNSEIGNDQ